MSNFESSTGQGPSPVEEFSVRFTGDAAALIRQFVRDAGMPLTPEAISAQVADALVTEKWVLDNVDEGRLWLLGARGVMTEVTRTRGGSNLVPLIRRDYSRAPSEPELEQVLPRFPSIIPGHKLDRGSNIVS